MLLSEQHERKDTEMVFEISKIVNCVYVFEGGSGFVFLFSSRSSFVTAFVFSFLVRSHFETFSAVWLHVAWRQTTRLNFRRTVAVALVLSGLGWAPGGVFPRSDSFSQFSRSSCFYFSALASFSSERECDSLRHLQRTAQRGQNCQRLPNTWSSRLGLAPS